MANKDFVQLGAVEADDLTDASIWKTNFVVNGELTLFAGEHCYERLARVTTRSPVASL